MVLFNDRYLLTVLLELELAKKYGLRCSIFLYKQKGFILVIIMNGCFKELNKPFSNCLQSVGNASSSYTLWECNRTLLFFNTRVWVSYYKSSHLKSNKNNNKTSRILFSFDFLQFAYCAHYESASFPLLDLVLPCCNHTAWNRVKATISYISKC